MRTTMHKKDLKKSDGFPADINREKTVAVLVTRGNKTILFYSNKAGSFFCGYANWLYPKFAEGIYILK